MILDDELNTMGDVGEEEDTEDADGDDEASDEVAEEETEDEVV